MKKLLAIALGVALLGFVSVQAAEKKEGEQKKRELTEEQKKVWKEIVAKYDADKNGKVSKEEREKISAEDKKKLKDAGIGGRKEGEKKEKKK